MTANDSIQPALKPQRRRGEPDLQMRELSSAAGLTGPAPAPVQSMACAISSRSSGVSSSVAAASQPSTCAGLRAPTMAPRHAGPSQRPGDGDGGDRRAVALGDRLRARRRAQIALQPSPWKSALRERQSSSAAQRRARVKAPGQQAGLHRAVDDHAGAVRVAPGQLGGGDVALIAENGGCSVSTWPMRSAASSCADIVVGQADGADLALFLQVEERLPVVFERRAVLGRPMHLVEVDALDAEPRSEASTRAACWPARRLARGAALRSGRSQTRPHLVKT